MKTTRRSTMVAAALGFALVAGIAAPSLADDKDDLKKKKSDVSGQISGAKKDLEHSSKEFAAARSQLSKARTELKTAQADLASTRVQLAEATKKDQQMQARLVRTEASLKKARKDFTQGVKRLDRSEAAVQQYAVETVQQGDRGLRAFSDLLQGEDPNTFSEQMSVNDAVGDAQVADMQDLAATKVVLKVHRDEVKELRDEVKVQRQAAAANLEVKKQLEATAAELEGSVSQLVRARSVATYAARKARSEDARQLHALEADRDRLRRQLEALAAKAAADAARRNGGGGGGGGSVSGDGDGTLSYPVWGPITSPYGMRVHPVTGVYKLHDGVDWAVPCGTPVKAAADGKVIAEYFNAGYGNRLILDNGWKRGKSVVTTYNHLTSWKASVGENVKRGEVIAYSGTTGYSTGCHLHFMVLVNGNVTNPMPWL